MTYKVTDFRGKLSTDSFLRQCNFRLHSKSLCLYMNTVPLIHHQKNFFLYKMETITETHHWLKLNEQMIVGVHAQLKHVQ